MGLNVKVINNRVISQPNISDIMDYQNYREMMSYLGYFNLIKKVDIVLAPSSECPLFIGNCEFLNINFLFNYLLRKSSMSFKLNESIFAGGKGFTMYKSICSSLGEAFERLMACLEYFMQKKYFIQGSYKELTKRGLSCVHPNKIKLFSKEQLNEREHLFDDFTENSSITWMPMKEMETDKKIMYPAGIILMYYAPQFASEKRIGYATSGGLTSHFTKENGRIHGLLEIIERHEINLSWYCAIPPKKIVLDDITNKKLKKYLDYIEQNEIMFYRHNVEQENFHVITAMSFDGDMTQYSFNAGGGIDEDIESAMLAALEEYTQSVNNTRKIVYAPKWLTSRFSNSVLEVHEGDDPKNFKTFYQAVSYYGLDCYKHDLDWYVKNNDEVNLTDIRNSQKLCPIEAYIVENKIKPVYSDLEMANFFENIYISKVYMPEFSTAFIAGVPALGHPSYKKFLKKGQEINKKILPFP